MIRLLGFILILFFVKSAISQVPINFGYSAIAMDNFQNAISNERIIIKIEIGNYSEFHYTKTNYSGAFFILIGDGKNKSGNFLDINWRHPNSISIKIARWITNNFNLPEDRDYFYQGVSNLYSTPYSLTAKYLEDSSLYLKNRDTINFVNLFTRQFISGKKIFSEDLIANDILIGRGSRNIESNLIIGNRSGINIQTGFRNSFFGFESGMMNTTGKENDFFGYISGKSNTSGSWNEFFGSYAGTANTTGNGNSFFGSGSGGSNINGSANTFLGYGSGNENISGNENVLVGYYAAPKLNDSNNVILGSYSGSRLRTGKNNVILGYFSGEGLFHGSSNTILGSHISLDSNLNNNIILSDGEGNIKLRHDSKNWKLYDDEYIRGNIIKFNPVYFRVNSSSMIPPTYIFHGLIVSNPLSNINLTLPSISQIEHELNLDFDIGTSVTFNVINESSSYNVNILLPPDIVTSFSALNGNFNSVVSPLNKVGTFELIYLSKYRCLIKRLY